MRASKKSINPSLDKQVKKLFFQTLADISSVEEAKMFIEDFLKESEVEMLTKRLAITYWLKKGRSYANIKTNLQVSSATIASVQQTMETPGIEFAIKQMEADEWAEKWTKKIKTLSRK